MMPSLSASDSQAAARDRLEKAADGTSAGTIAFSIDGLPLVRTTYLLDASDTMLRLAAPIEDLPLLHGRVAVSSAITLNLRHGNEDLFFVAELLKFEIDPAGKLVILSSMPAHVAVSQRRRGFRSPIDAGDAVAVRLWRMDKQSLPRDRPLPSNELPCELLDLGAGGMRAVVRPRGTAALNLNENDRLRVELVSGKHQLVIEGRLRHPKSTLRDDAQAICGIRFVDRDDIDTRRAFQSLQLILADLQRASAKRRNVA